MLGRLFAKTDRKQAPVRRGAPMASGSIQIDGVTYPLASWSQSGFLAENYAGDRKSRDKVEVAVSVALDDGPFDFTCTAMLVRVDRDGRKVVGSFFDMDTGVRVEMARRLGT